MGCRKDDGEVQISLDLPGEEVHLKDPVDLIPEKLDAKGILESRDRHDLHHIPPDTEGSPLKIQLISHILDIDQPVEQGVPLYRHAGTQGDHHLLIVLLTADAIDTGNRGNHDHIPALDQGSCGTVP